MNSISQQRADKLIKEFKETDKAKEIAKSKDLNAYIVSTPQLNAATGEDKGRMDIVVYHNNDIKALDGKNPVGVIHFEKIDLKPSSSKK